MLKYNFLLTLFISFFFVKGQDNKDSIKIQLENMNRNAIAKKTILDKRKKATPGIASYELITRDGAIPFWVFVPSGYDKGKKTSMVVFLHGGIVGIDSFQNKNISMTKEPIFDIAERYSCIVLYPFGKKYLGWVKQKAGFKNVLAMINDTEKRYNIDKSNIYLGGMSNGGSASFWYITHHPSIFRGFYALSSLPKILNDSINFKNITHKKPLYSINAEDDSVFKYKRVKSMYEINKQQANGWHFETVNNGGHGFLYGTKGDSLLTDLIGKLFIPAPVNPKTKKKYVQVIRELDSIGIYDQKYRNQLELTRQKYGGGSDEMRTLFKKIDFVDSANLSYVKKVIKKYGWLAPNDVGKDVTGVLFFVIQHSDLKSQKEFLPLLTKATKRGELKPSRLALLADRIALSEKHKQVYGSQISWNLKENTYVILPIADPDNVDKRRTKVGLNSLSDYVKDCCNISWDVEKHKQESLKQTIYH